MRPSDETPLQHAVPKKMMPRRIQAEKWGVKRLTSSWPRPGGGLNPVYFRVSPMHWTAARYIRDLWLTGYLYCNRKNFMWPWLGTTYGELVAPGTGCHSIISADSNSCAFG